MPRSRTYGSPSPSPRRGRLWLLLVLAAGVGTVWKIIHIGSSSLVIEENTREPSQTGFPKVDSGGVRGEEGQASPRGGTGEGEGAVGEQQHGNPPQTLDLEGLELVREGVGEEKGEEERTKDGGKKPFSLKVGSMQLSPVETLDFSLEDGRPGLLWLPIGLHETASGDPWVTMCLMDYGHYQDNPSSTPMFAHLHSFSKCGQVTGYTAGPAPPGLVSLVRMSSLMNSIKEQGREPLPPKGFVYHETRCGSTLVANMLASLPPSRVFSESKPPTQAIRECHAGGCSKETLLKVFRNVVALMGRRRNGEEHEHLYFKFQNSKFIPEISEAFPEVPWVFVFRDPVEVMVSNLKSYSGAPCVRIPRQEKLRKAGLGGKNPALKKYRPGVSRGKLPPRRRSLRDGGVRETGEGTGVAAKAAVDYYGDRRHGHRYDAVSPPPGVNNASWEGSVNSRREVFDESVSWNGFTDGGFDSFGVPFSGMRGGDEGEHDGGDGRSLKLVGASKFKLTMNMTVECADWLKSLCVSAVEGGEHSPSTALFVDYHNLPEAVPEHVFPEHFGMQKDMDRAVPDWRELMLEAAGSYSKGSVKGKNREFRGDAEEKHKQASPLIVEASEVDGGLYDLYHSLDAKQKWRRPEEDMDEEKDGT